MKIKHFCFIPLIFSLFTSCIIHVSIGGAVGYYDSTGYSVGNAEITEAVDKIDLSWFCGSSEIRYYDGETVKIEETASYQLNDDEKVHYRNNNGTLLIKFGAPDLKVLNDLKKDLIIYIPENTILKSLTVNNASASIYLNNIYVTALKINSASGSVKGDLLGTVNTTNIDVSSGSIDIKGDIFNSIDLDSASGFTKIDGNQIKQFNVDSASGSIIVTSRITCDSGDIDITSGSVKLYLPGDEGFSVVVSKLTGSFTSDFMDSMTGIGSTYRYGDGVKKFTANILSGSVEILKI